MNIMTGVVHIAMIELSETNFVAFVITIQTSPKTTPAFQFKAKIVPNPDATDFPPVKPKKIDLL